MKPAWIDEGLVDNPGGRIPLPRPRPLPARVPHPPRATSHHAWRDAKPTDSRAATIERLVPIARHLATGAGAHGIIVADIRKEAERRGIIRAPVAGRGLSYIWQVPGEAGLVKLGTERRRSDIGASHGNLQQVWVLPEFAR